MSKAQENTGWLFLAVFGALLLWLLTKGQQVLHASATTLIQPDPATGAPQFNSNDPTTYDPNQYAASIKPICQGGGPLSSSPSTCSCPEGYTLWHDTNSGNYFCFPNPGTQ